MMIRINQHIVIADWIECTPFIPMSLFKSSSSSYESALSWYSISLVHLPYFSTGLSRCASQDSGKEIARS